MGEMKLVSKPTLHCPDCLCEFHCMVFGHKDWEGFVRLEYTHPTLGWENCEHKGKVVSLASSEYGISPWDEEKEVKTCSSKK